jgi:hypothetical protein
MDVIEKMERMEVLGYQICDSRYVYYGVYGPYRVVKRMWVECKTYVVMVSGLNVSRCIDVVMYKMTQVAHLISLPLTDTPSSAPSSCTD